MPRSRGVGPRHRGDHRSAADRADVRDHAAHRASSSVGPRPRCATCSISTSSWSAVGVALGFGATFFNAAQDELDRHARLAFSRGARITPARLGDRGPLIGAGAVGIGAARDAYARAERPGSSPAAHRSWREDSVQMTKIRSTRRQSMVEDRAGQGGGGGGVPGLGGLGRLGFPVKAGGGLLGSLAARRDRVPAQAVERRRWQSPSRRRPGATQSADVADGTCEQRARADRCAAPTTTCRTTGRASSPVSFSTHVRGRRDGVLHRLDEHRLRPGVVADRPVLLPGRRARVLRPRLPRAAAGQFGAPGDLAAQYIVAHEYGHHIQNLIGQTPVVSRPADDPIVPTSTRHRARAAGRLLRRHVGQRRANADGRSIDATRSTRRSTPRPPSATTASSSRPGRVRPGDVHPRHVRAARSGSAAASPPAIPKCNTFAEIV